MVTVKEENWCIHVQVFYKSDSFFVDSVHDKY